MSQQGMMRDVLFLSISIRSDRNVGLAIFRTWHLNKQVEPAKTLVTLNREDTGELIRHDLYISSFQTFQVLLYACFDAPK